MKAKGIESERRTRGKRAGPCRGEGVGLATRDVLDVLGRLEAMYGPRETPRRGMEEVGALVATILSQSTTDVNSARAYRRLREEIPTWNEAADCDVARVEAAIRVAGLSRQKAPRIQAILQQIRAERGRIDLSYLRRMTPEQATAELTRFDGVGPKTAACVLMFACRMGVFPVDTHVHRICTRLGWTAEGMTAGATQAAVEPRIPPDKRYAMHVLMIEHGKRTCVARGPRCGACAVRPVCDYGRTRGAEVAGPDEGVGSDGGRRIDNGSRGESRSMGVPRSVPRVGKAGTRPEGKPNALGVRPRAGRAADRGGTGAR